jgi:hypothetical protein
LLLRVSATKRKGKKIVEFKDGAMARRVTKRIKAGVQS